MFKIGDIVKYSKTNKDSLFKIKEIKDELYILYGINNRQIVISTIEHICLVNNLDIENMQNNENRIVKKLSIYNKNRKSNKYLFGKVLHIDGDEELLNKCLDLYKELGVFAQGICIKEEDTHLYIEELIKELTPDIVVITGHDQFDGNNKKDIYSYKNTPNFIKAIKELRKHSSDIVIIAGACASHFEALIASGANIASSPKRINTHTYDPAIAAIKVATTPYDARVDFKYIYKYIENGKDALGGVETNGKMKLLL